LLLSDIDTLEEVPTKEEVIYPLKKELKGKVARYILLEKIHKLSDEELIKEYFEN
jgi:hypothetical protein